MKKSKAGCKGIWKWEQTRTDMDQQGRKNLR